MTNMRYGNDDFLTCHLICRDADFGLPAAEIYRSKYVFCSVPNMKLGQVPRLEGKVYTIILRV